jgi:hypothetical protein
MTLKKVQNEDETAFNLRVTFHDGSARSLSFVRKISNDDKQRIQNIYLKIKIRKVNTNHYHHTRAVIMKKI